MSLEVNLEKFAEQVIQAERERFKRAWAESHGMYRALSDDKVELVKQMAMAGESRNDIAKHFGVSGMTISRITPTRNGRRYQKKLTPEDLERGRKMRDLGVAAVRIGAALGVSVNTVKRHIPATTTARAKRPRISEGRASA